MSASVWQALYVCMCIPRSLYSYVCLFVHVHVFLCACAYMCVCLVLPCMHVVVFICLSAPCRALDLHVNMTLSYLCSCMNRTKPMIHLDQAFISFEKSAWFKENKSVTNLNSVFAINSN